MLDTLKGHGPVRRRVSSGGALRCGLSAQVLADIPQGSGLGLTIVHSIVRKHDSHIRVLSKPGEGTVFTIFLPASPHEVQEAEPRPGDALAGTGRVLVMDDDEAVLESAAAMLQHLGYEVDKVRSGLEALDAYEKARHGPRRYEDAILDLTIAGEMGGAETVRRLRSLDPNVIAIASSGYSSDPILANHRTYGFEAALAKPYGVNELSKVLLEVCRNRAARG